MSVRNEIVTAVLFGVFALFNLCSTAMAKNVDLGGDFTLVDHNDQSFTLNQLRGKVVLVFFGYTSCPDICPTELGKMAQILGAFENESGRVKGLFITVDPVRDSPQRLKEYTAYFGKHLQGLTGSQEQIDRVTRQYQVKYHINQSDNNRITVDHSSNLYVIDKHGSLNTIIPFGLGINHVVSVVEWLLEK